MDSGVGLVRASMIFLMKYGELGGEKSRGQNRGCLRKKSEWRPYE